jgi:RimJ/RimL family protein N-acetyltransferase
MSQTAVKLRPATLDDVETVCAIDAAYRPDDPTDPVVERYIWATAEPALISERWIAETAAGAGGYGTLLHADWALGGERDAQSWVGWLPERAAIIPDLLEQMEGRARALGVRRLTIHCREGEAAVVEALRARGYRLDSLSQVLELDLRRHRTGLRDLVAESRSEMAIQGLRLLPLSEHAASDPYRELYEAWSDSRIDVPRSHQMTPTPFEQWVIDKRAPDHSPETEWIAVDGGRIVGLSSLRYPPTTGRVWTTYTGSVRSHRGRGIGRAVKMETLAQAIERGVDTVRTDNDERNAAMLHINDRLGYTPLPAFARYEVEV